MPTSISSLARFQSTPPGWEATGRELIDLVIDHISIHASRVGGDGGSKEEAAQLKISIHASRVGGDLPFSHSRPR